MIFTATSDGWLDLGGRRARCALGRGGVIAAREKTEGDGATPAGVWPLRHVLFRSDRGGAPKTALPASPIRRADGWCDDPSDPAYNRLVTLPYPARAEPLWRDDGLYDVVVILGHNDDPVVPGAGSAIFLHLARPDFTPTEGCVAAGRPDLEVLLALAQLGDALAVAAP